MTDPNSEGGESSRRDVEGHPPAPVRLGVIGCGVIGQQHLAAAAASPLLEVVAVADRRLEAAREAAARFGARTASAEADDLLADPGVEAVVLALPTAGRAAIARRAFAAGKHVLLEKPVAMNAAEVRALLAARGALVAACCSSRFRFLPSAVAAAALVGSGALGPLRLVRCRAVAAAAPPPALAPPAWRLSTELNGGGILANWGSYDLDYLLGITGWALRPRLVLAQTWSVPARFAGHVAPPADAETHVAALVRCDGGAAITLERGELVATAGEEAWQIVGTDGALRLTMTPGVGATVWHDVATSDRGTVSRPLWRGDETFATVHAGPATDFARAIRGARPPLTGLDQALTIQEIVDAVYASAARGTAVPIGDHGGAAGPDQPRPADGDRSAGGCQTGAER